MMSFKVLLKLPLGTEVFLFLWQRVQDKIKELDGTRTKGTKHCYPLSVFVGSGAWGRNATKSTYYYNRANKIRVRTGVFESAAEKILHHVVENSAAFRQSVADYAARKDASVGVVDGKIVEVDKRLAELALERRKLDDRLSFLLESNNMELARSFRDEYKKQFSALQNEERELGSSKVQLQLLQKQIREAQVLPKDSGLECVNTAINCIKRKDAIALKSAYRKLFEKIIVRPMDDAKVRLQFIFKNLSTPSGDDEVANCISAGLVVQDSLCAISVRNIKFYIELDTYTTSPPISACVLRHKYLENRLSMRDIAREFLCSKTRIRSLLMRYGIQLREPNKYHKDHWRIYGKRRASGKAVDHQRELCTIAAIKKMYAEGMGITAIAKTLSTMKIPTKRQGKGWDHSTVTAIIRREGCF